MRIMIVVLAMAVIAPFSSAELINWLPSDLLTVGEWLPPYIGGFLPDGGGSTPFGGGSVVPAGWLIEMYQDVNGDNGATYYNDLRLDNTGAVTSMTGGNTLDDVLFGESTVSIDAGGGNIVLQSVTDISVSAGDHLYSVIFNAANKSLATRYAVFEATPYVVPAGSGISIPNGTMGVGIAVPEPSTVALMGAAGSGLFLARKRKTSKYFR